MFDIRKIQEQALYGAVKNVSGDEAASEVVYGTGEAAGKEDDPTWVKSAMKRLESHLKSRSLNRSECIVSADMEWTKN